MAQHLFEKSFIDELNDRTNIVDLIGQYIPLKKGSGHNYKCCCPFHTEKTPSFEVNEEKNTFKCFGGSCGESGDPVGFLMKYQNINFVEAVRELANFNGIQLPIDNQDKEFTKFRRQYMEFNSRLSCHLQSEALTDAGQVRLSKIPISEDFKNSLQLGTVIDTNRLDKILVGASLSKMRDTLEKVGFIDSSGNSNIPSKGLFMPITTKRGATLGFTFIDNKLNHYVLPESDMLQPEGELINIANLDPYKPAYIAMSFRSAVIAHKQTGSSNIAINPAGQSFLSDRQFSKVKRATNDNAVFVIPKDGEDRHFAIASLLSSYDPSNPVRILDTRTGNELMLLDHLEQRWSMMPDEVQEFYREVAVDSGKEFIAESIMLAPEKNRELSPALN